MDAIEAATMFIEQHFSNCLVALLAGSVVRGEATKTSDLDIVVILPSIESAYRESFYSFGWPIEIFVHNEQSLKEYMQRDVDRRRPSLPQMCSEGIVIRDSGRLAESIKKEANRLLDKGVKPLSQQEQECQRYMITDLLDDLIGGNIRDQEIFIVNELAEKIANLILISNNRWLGKGKWIAKNLEELNKDLYLDFITSLNEFYIESEKEKFIDFVEGELDKYGGRLFEGYSAGK